MKKLVTKDSITIDWLQHNGYALKLPNDTVTKILLCNFLYKQVKEGNGIKVLLAITKGVSRSMLYDYRRIGFDVPPKFQARKKKVLDKIQEVRIIDKTTQKNTKYSFQFTLKELTEQKPQQQVSIDKALQYRNELIKEQESNRKHFKSVEETEDVALKICQLFASGRITVYEACNRSGVSYLDFFKWVVDNENIRAMYEDSIKVAKFVTESQIYTEASNMILERLRSGYTSATDIIYDFIWVNGTREQIEKTKKVNNRELTVADLIRVLHLLKNEISAPDGTGDQDFENMSDDELWEYVEDIRKRQKNNE